MKTRKRFILAKIESTYGVDAVPTVANDSVLTTQLSRTIYEGNTVERNLDQSTLGLDEQINTGPYATISFGVEIAGAGTAGDAPPWGYLLRGSGFAETVDAGVSVEYDPASDEYDSLTIHYWSDGERQIITGCRGTVQFMMNAGTLPMMMFTFTGLYQRPTSETIVTPDPDAFLVPLPVNKRNTPTCTLDSYEAVMQALDVDFANDVTYQNFVNLEEVFLVDRAPAGSVTLLAPRIGTKDLFSLMESDTGVIKSAFQLVHGTVAGNIITLDAPKAQLSGITETDINGELGYQSNLRLLPDLGDDELKITVA